MSDNKSDNSNGTTPEKNSPIQSLILVAVVIGAIVMSFRDWHMVANILQVLIGFGAVIFVHELGHFAAAKGVGIKVEAFSLGFGPVLLSFRRVEGAFQVALLPSKDNQKGLWHMTLPCASAKEGETDYRLSIIPLGGYVKMLGQEDVAADKPTDDPRAFVNKKVWERAVVISAGVIMNVISAAIMFMIVFSVGVELPPAVVGGVSYGSPAYEAGLRAGDEIVAIGDRSEHLKFQDIMLGAAFADPCKPVPMTVKHPDGKLEDYAISPVMSKVAGTKIFGIAPPTTLKIGNFKEEELTKALNEWSISPGDTIVEVNEQPVSQGYQYHRMVFPQVGQTVPKSYKLTLASNADDPMTFYDVTLPTALMPAGKHPGQMLGVSPRVQVSHVVAYGPAFEAGFKGDDIIVTFGDLSCPAIEAVQTYCRSHADQPISVTVERMEDGVAVTKELTVTPQTKLTPWQGMMKTMGMLDEDALPPARIGVMLGFDLDTPVVAGAEDADETAIPAGSVISKVGIIPVNDWLDIYNVVMDTRGQSVTVTYKEPGSDQEQTKMVAIAQEPLEAAGFMAMADFGMLTDLPLEQLEHIYKGNGLGECLQLGMNTTFSWIAQNYMFIKGMFTRKVSASAASGPVGILKMSYTISSEKSLVFYCYFMSIISVALAVFNFLPLPVLDGGHFVMLIIEKIKGSPVPIKIQEVVTYIGLGIILLFALYVTFNDIVKVATGQL